MAVLIILWARPATTKKGRLHLNKPRPGPLVTQGEEDEWREGFFFLFSSHMYMHSEQQLQRLLSDSGLHGVQ